MHLKKQKIVEELSENCRITDSALAKKVKEPRHIVAYYRKKLQKEGTVKGTELFLNYKKMGFEEYVVYLKIRQYSKYHQEIKKIIKRSPYVRWAAEVFPSYNLRIAIVSRNFSQVENVINEIQSVTNYKIEKREIIIVKEILKNEVFTKTKKDRGAPSIKNLSKNDKKLLLALSIDCTSSLLKLAKQSNLSIEAVRRKIKTFQQQGIIVGFMTKFDKPKIGFNFWGQISANITNFEENLPKIKKLIHLNDFFGRSRHTFGKWNLEFTLLTRSYEQLKEIVKILEETFQEDFDNFELLITAERIVHHRIPKVVL